MGDKDIKSPPSFMPPGPPYLGVKGLGYFSGINNIILEVKSFPKIFNGDQNLLEYILIFRKQVRITGEIFKILIAHRAVIVYNSAVQLTIFPG